MQKNNNLKKIFLTFDDGPCEPYTAQILDILKENNIKASFFVCGRTAEYYPHLTRRIVEEGHCLGNHTYSHSLILTLSGCLKREIEKTDKIIQKITGIKTCFFRPPWGFTTPWLKSYLKKNHYQLVLWDVNSYDWLGLPYSFAQKRILKKTKNNSILLFHDGREAKLRYNDCQAVLLLPLIVKKLKKQGFLFGKIDELKQ